MANFVEDARLKLNRRFGLTLVPLVADTDTNPVLTEFPLLYLYAAVQSGFEYLNNGNNAQYIFDKWEIECDRQNILNPYSVTDHYTADAPPAMLTAGEIQYNLENP